ncbi:MAG: glycosyltransferase family 2 protein [Chloroflexi bacterium]|nr:glycosyltransferase family 2 protein [Chloroflexota bacterium]
MRVGHNPARFVEKVAQPAEVTVAVVNCIPFLSGYYEQSLDVLKVAVTSIHESTPEQHDLMVFDNHSCPEVRQYLQEAYEQGIIQYLVLSDKNIGKIGAWNFMFSAAQGKYVAFSDGDVGFRPGWLPASLALFEAFPNVGMVTARPMRGPLQYCSASLDWGRQHPNIFVEGHFMDWETFWEHAKSLGLGGQEARASHSAGTDFRLTFGGKVAYIGAAHFQFMARCDVLRKIIPLPSSQPMRGERALDIAINEMELLRLGIEKPLVWHIGNSLPDSASRPVPVAKRKSLLQHLLWLPVIRNALLWLNNRIFRLYFFNVE